MRVACLLFLSVAACSVDAPVGRYADGAARDARGDANDAAEDAPAECLPDPADSSCRACMKNHCCAELVPCEAQPICHCLTICVLEGHSDCEVSCGGVDDGSHAPLAACAERECSAVCP